MSPFESVNYNFFNAKPKPLEDKVLPDSLVSLKISKKHLETSEMKDRIIREALAALTQYLSTNADSIAFLEMCLSVSVILRKFKQQCTNNTYRKSVQTFLELLQSHQDVIQAERAKIKDKSLKDAPKLTQQFSRQLQVVSLPIVQEAVKQSQRRDDQIN